MTPRNSLDLWIRPKHAQFTFHIFRYLGSEGACRAVENKFLHKKKIKNIKHLQGEYSTVCKSAVTTA